jgi:hypothetical protein
MVPAFLFPDSIACEDGHGAETSLGDSRGRSLLLTLGITRILEQESLDVSIWGSADGHAWQLLASFPRKFYCGIYSLMLDLSRRCEIRYLRAHWRMGRWGGGESKPLAGFYLSLCPNGSPAKLTSRAHSRRLRASVAEEAKIQVSGAA